MYGLGIGESLFKYEDISLSTLRRAVDACVNEDSSGKVRFKSVVAYEDPEVVLNEIEYRLENTEIVLNDEGDHYRVELYRTIERSDIDGGERTVEGSFGLFQNEGTDIWTAVTGHGPDFYKRGLRWLFKQTEPHISDFYINSDRLEEMLIQFEQSLSSDIEIEATKAVAYSHTEEGNISFETRPYREVFQVAEDDNRYVDKIKFVASATDRHLLTAFLTRSGQMKLLSGSVGLFFDTLLPLYAGAGQEKAEVVQNKERSSDTGDVQEVELKFDEAIFRDVEDNQKLINALDDLTNSSLTVYHNNPYAHVSVLDFIDGSSCDVFITEPDRISIVPSYRGSANSLMRISEQLSRELDEGDFRSVEQPDYEFSDFFA